MATITANTITFLPLLKPVKGLGNLRYVPSDAKTVQSKAGLTDCSPCVDRRRAVTHSSRMQSLSIICAAAITCSAEQTQTVTHKAPTITHVPGKEKGPELADGGGGFPPRDDGGGGGGGGGGENFSGGFFLFGFLAFLGFLKELDKDNKRDNRR